MSETHSQVTFADENLAYNAWYSANCTFGCHNSDAVESVYGLEIWRLRNTSRPIIPTRDMWEAGLSQFTSGAVELVGEVAAGSFWAMFSEVVAMQMKCMEAYKKHLQGSTS